MHIGSVRNPPREVVRPSAIGLRRVGIATTRRAQPQTMLACANTNRVPQCCGCAGRNVVLVLHARPGYAFIHRHDVARREIKHEGH